MHLNCKVKEKQERVPGPAKGTNLPAPDVIAAEIVENLEAAPGQFSSIYQEPEGEK
jgi:hypothetical protein